MSYNFQIGNKYRRKDVYKIIGIDEDTHGGNWDTGYNQHDGNWFIFCNIGVPGKTGHDYANEWVDNKLHWYGKTNTHLNQPTIQSMISGKGIIYIFWRENNGDPFTFAGQGIVNSSENVTPVKIVWGFNHSQ